MTTKITVLICDDDLRVCDALREVVDAQADLTTVAIAHDAVEAATLAHQYRPTVAVVDVRMPGGGARAVRDIRAQSPDTRVLAFSAHNDNGAVEQMRDAGADAYLVKGAPVREIVAAIRDLAGSAAS